MNLIRFLLILIVFNSIPGVQAQEISSFNQQAVETAIKSRFSLRRELDSINAAVIQLRGYNDSITNLLHEETVKLEDLRKVNKQLSETNENLNTEIETIKGEKLQTSHTSSILLIFNIIVGLILLVALIWMYNRKKSGSESEDEAFPQSTPIRDQVEAKLDRIEKLGKLRDKGLLTEEEFQIQKRQILA
jgi:hypothetical protein